ncbi:MAG: tetratricopeptide repeat protein [Bacteroidota bacterium]
MRHFSLIFLCLLGSAALSQTQEEIIQRQIMDKKKAEKAALDRTLEQGVALMQEEKYDEAEINFKKVLKESRVVPTILTFHFGKNSYYLGKYKQSIDWLNKYLELKGTDGRFYDECTELLKLANASYLALRQEDQEKAAQILASDYQVDCGPTGKVICPVCKGRGVIIEVGPFGNTYKTCPYSDNHGQLTCDEYNLLLRGELKPKF